MSRSSDGVGGLQGPRLPEHSQSRHQGLRIASGVHSLVKLWLLSILHVGITYARPFVSVLGEDEEPKSPDDPSLYIYLGVALFLVLLGGVFAGLTIALMGQDEIYLQVIASSGEGAEKKNATKVLNLLKKGKHWVLVTLLVGNVITNETLPLVLDRSIGGGYIAAITSTALVIIFGEIVPQSACVRFGLPIGAWCANFVFVLMWLLSPISWPIAKLLDYLLGEDHGTTYKKAGLKTLVTLHQTIGPSPADRLNEDEVAIIKGVLDLKAKSVGSIMTPMKDVFTLSTDAILDEDMIDDIEHEGYSRIPIHNPENKGDFLGMLLVKMLITYDPEDAKRVSDFSLATLPETRPETSCLDIINFFQEGKSHMVLVSDFPGETYGALGVVTLEDVIEELIGEEIIDESDVFVDVHKAIRRMHPAPTHRARAPKGEVVTDTTIVQSNINDDSTEGEDSRANGHGDELAKQTDAKRLSNASVDGIKAGRPTTFLVRRKTSLGTAEGDEVQKREYDSQLREHLKRLGPSNAANAPRGTRVNTVKIKPGPPGSAGQDTSPASRMATPDADKSISATSEHTRAPFREGKGQDLVTPGKAAKDGVQALKVGSQDYGTSSLSSRGDETTTNPLSRANEQSDQLRMPYEEDRGRVEIPTIKRSDSHSTLGDYNGPASRSMSNKRGQARSGSITEQFVESGGVRKLVLELTSSSEEGAEEHTETSRNPSRGGSKPTSVKGVRWGNDTEDNEDKFEEGIDDAKSSTSKKKRRSRKKRFRGSEGDDKESENTPLLRP